MAVVKFSGLVTAIVGKINGSVFQGGPYGTIVRSNNYGRRPQGKFAYGQRSDFFAVVNYNRQLTLDERNAMNDFAITLSRPTKAGSSTPYNWWSLLGHVNGNLQLIGESLIKEPFVVPSMPDISPFVVEHVDGESTYKASWTGTSTDDWRVVISASGAISERDLFKRSRTRVITLHGSKDGNVTFEGSLLVPHFGRPAFGAAHWWSATLIHVATGWSSPPLTFLYQPA